MSNIYCGASSLPKNHRYGTMKECAKSGQIRYYGLKKVDPKSIKASKKVDLNTRESLLIKFATLKGTIRKNKGRYETTKDKKAKEEYYKVWKDAEKDIIVISEKLKKIESIREAEKNKSKE